MLDTTSNFSVDVAMPALAGLRYVCDNGPAIRRRRAGKGFVYLDSKGRRVGDPAILKRIRSLAIPPAWTDVWKCPSPEWHIQATGRDAKGRKQHRYHADYRGAREEAKFEHIVQFAKALSAIRATVAEHMRLRGLPVEGDHILGDLLHRAANPDQHSLLRIAYAHVKAY